MTPGCFLGHAHLLFSKDGASRVWERARACSVLGGQERAAESGRWERTQAPLPLHLRLSSFSPSPHPTSHRAPVSASECRDYSRRGGAGSRPPSAPGAGDMSRESNCRAGEGGNGDEPGPWTTTPSTPREPPSQASLARRAAPRSRPGLGFGCRQCSVGERVSRSHDGSARLSPAASRAVWSPGASLVSEFGPQAAGEQVKDRGLALLGQPEPRGAAAWGPRSPASSAWRGGTGRGRVWPGLTPPGGFVLCLLEGRRAGAAEGEGRARASAWLADALGCGGRAAPGNSGDIGPAASAVQFGAGLHRQVCARKAIAVSRRQGQRAAQPVPVKGKCYTVLGVRLTAGSERVCRASSGGPGSAVPTWAFIVIRTPGWTLPLKLC